MDFGELQIEVDTHMEHNELTDANIVELVKQQEEVTGATEKLRTLGDLKGKICLLYTSDAADE